MSEKFENLKPAEQAKIRQMIDKDLPPVDVRMAAAQSAFVTDLRAAGKAALIRSALNGSTEWLRFIDNENGRELSELEMRSIRSKLVECDLALRQD